ncbi:hypothetical protein VM1G_06495 [Cytospora mali]|uniref:ENTH domain-containing protein n=1 Tax=Cytospora mali TaxID=578113 RepID=A0A194W3D6_CYTMA|nr:hypothetical protein VM1G_06495 [Valsa mali]
MDINSLKDTVSNLTLYDIKAGVRKVQNAVMNYTEMESKVREATNNEPWGASSSLMQEIANGTFNYQTLNEIMPMIYRRFTEKAAEEWRQIYKALQLLEYLIKHGSERVIDDARSHLTLLKMLRQFHFIDQNGKDQGINVRNRAKELTDLLGDVDRIRAERKKARANKAKYTGVEGGTSFGGGFSGSGGSSSRYGGFGSETGGYSGGSANFGGFSGGVYGDGGGFGGNTSDFRDSSARRGGDQFEEYDEYDEPSQAKRRTAERAGTKKTTPVAAPAEPPKKKEPEVDLFSFDEPSSSAVPAAAPSNGSGLASLSTTIPPASNDDDDFDDFQSATPAGQTSAPQSAFANPMVTSNAYGATFAAPAPVSGPQQANLTDMMGISSISPPPASTATNTPGVNYSAFSTPLASAATMSPIANKPVGSAYQPSGPNYFTSVQAPQKTSTPVSVGGMGALKPVTTGSSTPKAKAASGGDAFGALWASASGGVKKQNTGTTGPALGQLAKEKSSAGIWGAPAAQSKPMGGNSQPAASSSSGLDDLLG